MACGRATPSNMSQCSQSAPQASMRADSAPSAAKSHESKEGETIARGMAGWRTQHRRVIEPLAPTPRARACTRRVDGARSDRPRADGRGVEIAGQNRGWPARAACRRLIGAAGPRGAAPRPRGYPGTRARRVLRVRARLIKLAACGASRPHASCCRHLYARRVRSGAGVVVAFEKSLSPYSSAVTLHCRASSAAMIGWINISVEAFIRSQFGDDAWVRCGIRPPGAGGARGASREALEAWVCRAAAGNRAWRSSRLKHSAHACRGSGRHGGKSACRRALAVQLSLPRLGDL